MEFEAVKDEIKACLAALRRGKPTEIDLDGLCNCMDRAVCAMEKIGNPAESEALFREDLISEIVRLSRAASALLKGVSTFDAGGLRSRLSSCDATTLLALRGNVRTGFARLLRSGELPRRTVMSDHPSAGIAEYRMEGGSA